MLSNTYDTAQRYGRRIYQRITEDRLTLVAAGVAFFIFLSIFPALASVISMYGLFTDEGDIREHMKYFSSILPADVLSLVEGQVIRFSESGEQKLGLGLLIGLLLSLWSANKAMKAVTQALNIALNFVEDRNFIKVNMITMALTFISSLAFTFTLAVLILVPVFISTFLSGGAVEGIVVIVSWSVMISTIFGIFILLYRKAPAMHGRIRITGLIPGALVATVMLILGSMVFSLYVANFGEYDAQYGTLASVVVTMFWLYIGAFIFLLGAEVNAVLYNQREREDGSKERVSPSEAVPS